MAYYGLATLAEVGSMHRTLYGILVLLVAACTSSDDSGSSSPTVVEHPNGSRSVTHQSVAAQPLQLTEDMRVGVADGSEDETFGEIRAFGVDNDGNVYVLDAQAQDVRVFDANGQFLRRIVRRGAGPAEVAGANGLFVHSDNTVWLNDPDNARFMHIDREGNELGTVKR
jgi:hypothetical protein